MNQSIIQDSSPRSFGLYTLTLFAFMFNIIISPSSVFPVLRVLHIQDILGGTAFVCFVVGIASSKVRYRWSVSDCYFTAFLLITALGLLNQDLYNIESKGLGRLMVSVKVWILYIMLSTALNSFRVFKVGFFVFLASVSLFLVHSVKAVIMGGAIYHGRFNSFVGMVSNPDAIGAFMTMLLPIFLELYLYNKQRVHKLYALGCSMACVLLLVLTQTRSAFLAVLFVMALWVRNKRRRRSRVLLAWGMAAVLVFVGVFLTQRSDYESYFARMKTIFASKTLEEDSNASSRLLLWKRGTEIWVQFPILGCGVGGMDRHVSMEGVEGGSLDDKSLHQSFIQPLAERGLVGFLAYCLFLISVYLACGRSARRLEAQAPESIYLAIASGLKLSLVGFFINAQFMTITESWVLVILSGFSVALWKLVRDLPVQGEPPTPNRQEVQHEEKTSYRLRRRVA